MQLMFSLGLALLLLEAVASGSPVTAADEDPAATAECAATGRNCRGGVRDAAVLRSETRLMRLFFEEMGLPLPAECRAPCNQLGSRAATNRCVGACYGAMLNSVNLERQLLS
ncbi:hypothetical protein BOX15_Mlig023147g3 [Macrostomum lignano]|uniref:Uncharacterized protein n=2 Tax=Macrostomum lignano TaxID=282301 RepID=A0A267FEL8_9PLAT|nr:hypothetical protein BOX15_Mlig023147g2 [Macrostomum lignano]PAA71607.1 hypothetical protein BOX15_Mlig023147g1 [Macrostomum lignano]PAA78561.1 hypothetical protein BOX15_Mlig023147g3 [Macrostomum lignano]